jgi:hypothetical protein
VGLQDARFMIDRVEFLNLAGGVGSGSFAW